MTSAAPSPASTAPPAVRVRDLHHAYGELRALAGVSLEVARGELFAVLGPNGSGKSTLFRLLATLLPVPAGQVSVLGHDPAEGAAAVRRALGVVFQNPSLDRELTVRENLLHHGHLYGLRGAGLERRIDEALRRFGLADRAGDRVAVLSGGLARRVEIAKALLVEPRVLLLDEPSTGLDPGARKDLATVLRGLADDGVAVLLTTHFMEEADRCDRLVLLDRGRVVAEGTPGALKDRLGGDVVTLRGRGGVGGDARALADALAERFPDLEPKVIPDPEGGPGEAVRFEKQDAAGFVARLAEAVPERIQALTVSRPTLEDVFLDVTGHSLYAARSGPAGSETAGSETPGSGTEGSGVGDSAAGGPGMGGGEDS